MNIMRRFAVSLVLLAGPCAFVPARPKSHQRLLHPRRFRRPPRRKARSRPGASAGTPLLHRGTAGATHLGFSVWAERHVSGGAQGEAATLLAWSSFWAARHTGGPGLAGERAVVVEALEAAGRIWSTATGTVEALAVALRVVAVTEQVARSGVAEEVAATALLAAALPVGADPAARRSFTVDVARWALAAKAAA